VTAGWVVPGGMQPVVAINDRHEERLQLCYTICEVWCACERQWVAREV